ncbi:unnamed protein product [Trifolium pratense]|uniref:Uncharacterized protein n=1 Tax=Trifolium pratense TaxID=57577 RepID=A0ACB0L423_TRIPR|nr:unnamed protein product [Trifolium pratense]
MLLHVKLRQLYARFASNFGTDSGKRNPNNQMLGRPVSCNGGLQ